MVEPTRNIRGPSLLSFIRGVKDPTPFYFYQLMREYGDVVHCGFQIYLVSHPDYARHILSLDRKRYEKSDLISKRLRTVFGNGIMTSDGEDWVNQRRWLHPHFSRKGVEGLMPALLREIDRFLEGWERRAAGGDIFDLVEEFSSLSMLIAGRAFLGVDLREWIADVIDLQKTGNDYILSGSPFFIPPWIPTPGHLRLRRANRRLGEILQEALRAREAKSGPETGVVETLSAALGLETRPSSSTGLFLDELRTLLISGSSTIAAALSMCWRQLASQPACLARLQAEIERGPAEPDPANDPAEAFPYTLQVILETLRLYSVAHSIWRKCTEEDHFDGYVIPRGASVMISLFNIHRRPDIWGNPDEFDPSRFEKERIDERPRHYYMPFGWGPRQCIGDHFSLRILPLVLIRMLQKFHLDIPAGQPLQLQHAPVMIPDRIEARVHSKTVRLAGTYEPRT